MATFKTRFDIITKDKARRIVAGFAKVSHVAGELVADTENDVVEVEELEKAAHRFFDVSRKGTAGHYTAKSLSFVGGMVITPEKLEAMGVPAEVAKNSTSGLWVEARVDDPKVWKRVTSGELKAFSIEGFAERVEVDD